MGGTRLAGVYEPSGPSLQLKEPLPVLLFIGILSQRTVMPGLWSLGGRGGGLSHRIVVSDARCMTHGLVGFGRPPKYSLSVLEVLDHALGRSPYQVGGRHLPKIACTSGAMTGRHPQTMPTVTSTDDQRSPGM